MFMFIGVPENQVPTCTLHTWRTVVRDRDVDTTEFAVLEKRPRCGWPPGMGVRVRLALGNCVPRAVGA